MSTMYVNNIAPLEGTTINVASGNTLYAPGSVIQVVQKVIRDSTFSTSSSSFVAVETHTITPTATTSKILITISGGRWGHYSGASYESFGAIYRGSTQLVGGSATTRDQTGASQNVSGNVSLTYLDSPNTTDAVSYSLYARTNNGSGTVYVGDNNAGNGDITITLMEIAG